MFYSTGPRYKKFNNIGPRVYYRESKGCIIMFDLTNRQSFLNITRCQYYKTFYARNLQIFLLSESVCQTKPEKPMTNILAYYENP